MKKNFWKLFFGAMFAFVAMTFASCVDDNVDTEAPYLEVTPTTLAFAADGKPVDGGASAFTISTNRRWVAVVQNDKSWVTLSETRGEGSATVQVSIPENINDEATVTIQSWNQVGPLKEVKVIIRSGDVKPAEVIYNETFGTAAPSSSPYPFVDQYTDFVKTGIGSSAVSYVGSAASLRGSGKLSAGYPNASGGSKLFFGANASFIVQKIALTSDQKDLRLTFGGSYYDGNTKDGEFKQDKFHYYLSADGVAWTEAVAYKIDKSYNEFWVYATSDFTLANAADAIYVKFVADEASVFSMDDPTLVTGNGGGPVIDLGGNPDAPQVTPAAAKLAAAKGSTVALTLTSTSVWSAQTTGSGFTIDILRGEGNGTITVTAAGDNTSAAEVALGTIIITNAAGSKTIEVSQAGSVGNVYFYTNVGTKDVSTPPQVSTYDDWQAKGSGASTVTFGGTEKTTVRSSGLANTGSYDGASGPNVVFFGTLPSYLTVNNITVPSSQTNMKLTFGASRSEKVGSDYVNTFEKANFLVSLSADGTNWKPLTYAINNGDQATPFWVFATADFTLKAGVSAIYVKFEAGTASVFRLDDITLAPSATGGQVIDLGGVSEPSVATANYSNLKDVSVTLGGSLANADVASYSAVGVQYVAFSTGTVNDIDWSKAQKIAAATKATPWTVDVTGLTAETQYAFRAYATPATGTELYGEAKTFVTTKTGGSATPISIANLIGKMTSTSTAVDNDYEIEGVICSDPTGLNFSFGTLFVMTQGATTAGNGLSLYNTKLTTANYALGDKIKVTLTKDVAKIYKRFDVPQVEGFDPAAIEVVSKGNTVTPLKVTLAELASYVCMPVTIENATTTSAGVWKEAGVVKNTTLKVAGVDFIVNINKNATPFDGKPYAEKTGSISGIASVYSSAGQLLPRNLDDVKAFNPSADAPNITGVAPTSVSLPVAGGTQAIVVTVANLGSSTLSVAGLSGILSASVSGTTVTVTAAANTGSTVSQKLEIAVSGGNSVEVPVTVAGVGGSDTKGTYTSMGIFVPTADNSGDAYYTGEIIANGKNMPSGALLKFGTSSKSGVFTSEALGVSGNKSFSFYGVAWKGKKATIYIKVNGGGTINGATSIALDANDGATGNPPFTVEYADSDYHTFKLEGLTAASTITISTNGGFVSTSDTAGRAVLCGMQLY